MLKCFIYSESALAVKLVHRHSTFNNLKQTIETNLAGYESQLAWGRPVGYIQAQPSSLAKDYLEQNQLVVRAGLELRISRFQVQHPNHWAMLPPYRYNISNGWSSADVIHTVAKQVILGHG